MFKSLINFWAEKKVIEKCISIMILKHKKNLFVKTSFQPHGITLKSANLRHKT